MKKFVPSTPRPPHKPPYPTTWLSIRSHAGPQKTLLPNDMAVNPITCGTQKTIAVPIQPHFSPNNKIVASHAALDNTHVQNQLHLPVLAANRGISRINVAENFTQYRKNPNTPVRSYDSVSDTSSPWLFSEWCMIT